MIERIVASILAILFLVFLPFEFHLLKSILTSLVLLLTLYVADDLAKACGWRNPLYNSLGIGGYLGLSFIGMYALKPYAPL